MGAAGKEQLGSTESPPPPAGEALSDTPTDPAMPFAGDRRPQTCAWLLLITQAWSNHSAVSHSQQTPLCASPRLLVYCLSLSLECLF